MKLLIKILLGLGLVFISCVPFAQEFDWTASNVDVANNYIVPKYQALALVSDRLREDIDALCVEADRDVDISNAIKQRYRDLFLAWAEVQHIQFGPVSFLKRYERFHYWPDKHNVGARQLRQLLADIAEGKVSADSLALAQKSVSVQGLSALERLLFSQSQVLNSSQCILAQKIAANLQDVAQQIDSSWRLSPVEFAKEFELASREQGTYGSSLDVATMLGNTLATQLLLIAEYKLGQALPKEPGGRVYQRELEAWLSESSLAIIEHSVTSLREFYMMAFAKRIETVDSDLHNKILAQFSKVIEQISDFDQPLIKTIVDQQKLATIVSLQAEIMHLETLVRSEVFAGLGFATRFNSLDGD